MGCCGAKQVTTDDDETTRLAGSESNVDYGIDLRLLDLLQLSKFMEKRMNEKTRDKIWNHLDKERKSEISRDKLNSLLVLTVTLYFTHKIKSDNTIKKPTKKELKEELLPVTQWIIEHKKKNESVITKKEYTKDIIQWLAQLHDGINYVDFDETPEMIN